MAAAHLCVHHIKGILCIYQAGVATQLLHLCYSMHGQRGFAAALWAIYLHVEVEHEWEKKHAHTV